MYTSTGHQTGTATAADDGRFELTNLEPGRYRIQSWARDLNPAEVIVPVTQGQQVRSLMISLDPASLQGVGGDVVGPDGKTATPNATVTFRLTIPPAPPPGQTGGFFSFTWAIPEIDYAAVTDDNGHFSVSLPRPMPGFPREFYHYWRVTVEAKGYLPHDYAGFWVKPEGMTPLHLQLFHGGRLNGVVRLADGSPLPPLTVAVLYDETAWLGSPGTGRGPGATAQVSPTTGQFDFGLVQSGEHWLTVQIPNWPDPRMRVTIAEGGSLEVTLTPPPGVVIKGRVLDAVTGLPVSGADVSAARTEQLLLDSASARTDQQGYYQLTPLEPGDISLGFSAKGMTQGSRKIHPESPGVQVVDFRLSLAR
jgi:hypothetical protein